MQLTIASGSDSTCLDVTLVKWMAAKMMFMAWNVLISTIAMAWLFSSNSMKSTLEFKENWSFSLPSCVCLLWWQEFTENRHLICFLEIHVICKIVQLSNTTLNLWNEHFFKDLPESLWKYAILDINILMVANVN